MSNQEALQHDFFIYVPSLRQEGPCMAEHREVVAKEYADLPPDQEGWVRIPLTGQLVVYARMLAAEEQVA